MRVRKRDGRLEEVDLNKITRSIEGCTEGLKVDTHLVAQKVVAGLYDGCSTRELDSIAVKTAANLIGKHLDYDYLAARLLFQDIMKEQAVVVKDMGEYISIALTQGIMSRRCADFMRDNMVDLEASIRPERDKKFKYLGAQTLVDRYFWRTKEGRIIETPQLFWMRVACGISDNIEEAIKAYNLFSTFKYIPSTPTLFNSGSVNSQLASCFLVQGAPHDSIESIYDTYKECAQLSKYAGGLGVSFSDVRSQGSYIEGTNGKSSGIIPFLKTLDSSVLAVNQAGKRRGACAVYLEPWHADIEEFLELRKNTGHSDRRTYNLNTALWIPDLFMKRVKEDGIWSLMDPAKCPLLLASWGDEFEKFYAEYEEKGEFIKQIRARELYSKMLTSLAETGHPYMCFKDTANRGCPQVTKKNGYVAKSSNLCSEIVLVTNDKETAVCNIGSINLAEHETMGSLIDTTREAVRILDRVIDHNWYAHEKAELSNKRWRPIGLGIMGWADYLYKRNVNFNDPEALDLAEEVQNLIRGFAVDASMGLAEEKGAFPAIHETEFKNVMRNSLLLAIAPTATIASLAGCFECIEPPYAAVWKRTTLSGDYMQVNHYLVNDLLERGLWSESMFNKILNNGGSVQGIADIPQELQEKYKTAFEVGNKTLIDLAAARQTYIDQSQSLNLFVEEPDIGRLGSMYMYAWEKGLKTTYYLRSKPKTQGKIVAACKIDDPDCESCQ